MGDMVAVCIYGDMVCTGATVSIATTGQTVDIILSRKHKTDSLHAQLVSSGRMLKKRS